MVRAQAIPPPCLPFVTPPNLLLPTNAHYICQQHFNYTVALAMSKPEIELHKQVEQQRISLKELIDRCVPRADKEQLQKQQHNTKEKKHTSNKT